MDSAPRNGCTTTKKVAKLGLIHQLITDPQTIRYTINFGQICGGFDDLKNPLNLNHDCLL